MVKNTTNDSVKVIASVNNKLTKLGYKHASRAKEMTDVVFALSSRPFFDFRFEIVSSRNSYFVRDLKTNKFFKIADLGDVDYDMGSIILAPFIVSKEPLELSDTRFNILHKLNGYIHSVGTLEISKHNLHFSPSSCGKKTQITRCIPIE